MSLRLALAISVSYTSPVPVRIGSFVTRMAAPMVPQRPPRPCSYMRTVRSAGRCPNTKDLLCHDGTGRDLTVVRQHRRPQTLLRFADFTLGRHEISVPHCARVAVSAGPRRRVPQSVRAGVGARGCESVGVCDSDSVCDGAVGKVPPNRGGDGRGRPAGEATRLRRAPRDPWLWARSATDTARGPDGWSTFPRTSLADGEHERRLEREERLGSPCALLALRLSVQRLDLDR
jgi:hypothetical protein